MLTRIGVVAAFAVLSGCALFQTTEPAEAPVVPVVIEPIAAPEPVKAIPRVAVLLSQDIPAFESIATELQSDLGADNVTVHSLSGKPYNSAKVMEQIRESNPDHLVSVGLLAAKVGRDAEWPMVFCQTYNYQEHGLVSDRSKGVSFLPPFEAQFESWQKLAPNLRSVGVLTGPNQEDLVARIERAAAKENIQVVSRTVSSDKEAFLEFKKLVPEIQGLLLLPDNRILSPRVLRQIMTTGAKRRTQIAVYSPALLDLGALISFSGDPADIADAIRGRIDTTAADGTIPGPALAPLSRVDVRVNPAVASHLSLDVPQQLADAR